MTPILKEADHILFSLPLIGCAATGAAASLLQEKSYAPVRAIGCLGIHTAMVLGYANGVILLTYSVAKVFFAKALNAATFEQFEKLKGFEEHAEWQLKVSMVCVSSIPLLIPALPEVIKSAYKAYAACKELNSIYEDFMDSDLFSKLENIYYEIIGEEIEEDDSPAGDDSSAVPGYVATIG